eukprot:130372-Rhodomonas_salina.1
MKQDNRGGLPWGAGGSSTLPPCTSTWTHPSLGVWPVPPAQQCLLGCHMMNDCIKQHDELEELPRSVPEVDGPPLASPHWLLQPEDSRVCQPVNYLPRQVVPDPATLAGCWGGAGL